MSAVQNFIIIFILSKRVHTYNLLYFAFFYTYFTDYAE